jgi:hypothetical protein
MAQSTIDNLTLALRRHVVGDPDFLDRAPLRVLGVGEAPGLADLRRSLEPLAHRCLFDPMEPDPQAIATLPAASYDLILCTQALESFLDLGSVWPTLVAACHPNGLVIATVASSGPARWPDDHVRLLPAGVTSLANQTTGTLVDLWHDQRGPWHDVVGVFSPRLDVPARADGPPPSFPADDDDDPLQNRWPDDGPAEVEQGKGVEYYIGFFERVHRSLAPRSYLEVGVDTGQSLRLAACPALGFDPDPNLTAPLAEHQQLVELPSDDAFASGAVAALGPVDLAFIDGMHLFEYVLRDFMNVEANAHAGTVVLVDDTCPAHPVQAERTRVSRFWTGDVWRLVPVLRRFRPDLNLILVDTDPTGILMVLGLDPHNRVLWDRFDEVVDAGMAMSEVPAGLLERHGAYDPRDPVLGKALARIGAHTDGPNPGAGVESALQLLSGALPRQVAQPSTDTFGGLW